MSGKQTEIQPPGLLWAESTTIRTIRGTVSPLNAMLRAVLSIVVFLDRFGVASVGSPVAQHVAKAAKLISPLSRKSRSPNLKAIDV